MSRVKWLMPFVLIIGSAFAQEPPPIPPSESAISPEAQEVYQTFSEQMEESVKSYSTNSSVPYNGVVGVGYGEGGKVILFVTPGADVVLPQSAGTVEIEIIESEMPTAWPNGAEELPLDHGSVDPLAGVYPVQPGSSTGPSSQGIYGTIGAKIMSVDNPDQTGYLTNTHVALSKRGCPAQLLPAKEPSPNIVQCHPGNTGCDNGLGTVETFTPIVMGGGTFSNITDAAFVQSFPGCISPVVSNGIGVLWKKPFPTHVNDEVMKSGARTGYTEGYVSAVDTEIMVEYGGCGIARFRDTVIIMSRSAESFSQSGDSGSVIVTKRWYPTFSVPVALLFAGSSTITVAAELPSTFAALGVKIDNRNPKEKCSYEQ